jgi:1-pyrroline-5-carboxylate dehydrogenase
LWADHHGILRVCRAFCAVAMLLGAQVVTQYGDAQLPRVLEALERMEHHLTAAVVSNDVQFVQHVLAHTVNGTTYAGICAGDPRGAGIGTPEAIRLVWSCHREVITDWGPAPPAASGLATS